MLRYKAIMLIFVLFSCISGLSAMCMQISPIEIGPPSIQHKYTIGLDAFVSGFNPPYLTSDKSLIVSDYYSGKYSLIDSDGNVVWTSEALSRGPLMIRPAHTGETVFIIANAQNNLWEALDRDGTILWRRIFQNCHLAMEPIFNKDYTLLAVIEDFTVSRAMLYAVSHDGMLLWKSEGPLMGLYLYGTAVEDGTILIPEVI